MSEMTWTWILFTFELIGITGMWFVGKKIWWGWAVVLVHSIPWFIYSVQYGKPGFIAMSFLWWTVNFINMRKWLKEKRVAPRTNGVSFNDISFQERVAKGFAEYHFEAWEETFPKNGGITTNVMPRPAKHQ